MTEVSGHEQRRFSALPFALSVSASAQQERKMPLIGYLDYRAAIDDEAFFQALRKELSIASRIS